MTFFTQACKTLFLSFLLVSSFVAPAQTALSFQHCPFDGVTQTPTLSKAPATFLRLGKPTVELGFTTLEDVATLTGAKIISQGSGLFESQWLCLLGTEGRKNTIAYLIADEAGIVTEVQLRYLIKDKETPNLCTKVNQRLLPFRIGSIGLGMSKKEVAFYLPQPRSTAQENWSFWFSQNTLETENKNSFLQTHSLGLFLKNNSVQNAVLSHISSQ